MKYPVRITAIVGSYRKGGIIDQAVDDILLSAREERAETSKIYLIDKHIEFCTNCRACTQKPGERRGECLFSDDMDSILDEIDHSDAIVLASSMNFSTVTAVMKRFLERLVCFAYWPWKMNAPKVRNKQKKKRALIVCSSAAPSIIARLSSQIVKVLKSGSALLGARTLGVFFIGLAAREEKQGLGKRTRDKAHRLGKRLTADA